jgi:transcriptional regulator with XRE-family HTH domain
MPYRSNGPGRLDLGRKPIDVILGERLAALRTVRGISRDRLGFILGTTANQIADYEAGTSRISPGHLIEICIFFEVKLTDLFPTSDRNHDPKLH